MADVEIISGAGAEEASSNLADAAFAQTYTIGEAAELLGTKYHKDYKKYFEAMCKRRGLGPSAALQAYVEEAILQDTRAWLDAFPVNLRSKSAYSKPKTAMLNLLSDEGVVGALGEAFCRNAMRGIESAFKTHSNSIVAQRLAADGTPATAADVAESNAKEADAEARIEQLTQELTETRERLESLKNLVVRLSEAGSLRPELGTCGAELLQELLKRW
jgi:hypothetical protein